MKSRELCIFLERIRSARGISQENMTADIVSLRQYRRYLNGESDIPFQIVQSLGSKLGIKVDSLVRDFESAKVEESKRVFKLYNYVINYDMESFNNLLNKIDKDLIIEYENQLIYKISIILYHLFMKKTDKEKAKEAIRKVIDYPMILKKYALTIVELQALSVLLAYESEYEAEKIANKLEEGFNNNLIALSTDLNDFLPITITALARYFGIKGKNEEVIKYCSLAIKRNIGLRSYYLNDYLYYYSALAYFKLGKTKEFNKSLFLAYNSILLDDNPQKTEKFAILFKKDFGIDINDFAAEYIKNL
ncbi:MAG: hypothetical protein WC964_03485 [Acholeplasmataceae bacterium]